MGCSRSAGSSASRSGGARPTPEAAAPPPPPARGAARSSWARWAPTPRLPVGTVYVAGEEWSARAAGERPLQRGTPVRVIRQEGLTVVVEPADHGGASTPRRGEGQGGARRAGEGG